jgi:uncharacterized Ntn-hydrolase superfamily protein
MTFSIAARCVRTGRFGVAVSSSSPAVAARCAYARAGVGAACTQNITDPSLGPRLLDLLGQGLSASEAMFQVIADARFVEYRQLTVIDGSGATAFHNGANVLGTHAVASEPNVIAAGNLLADRGVPAGMVAAFHRSPEDDLGDRLLAAMQAALAAGGEEGPVHSVGMLIHDQVSWPVTDLRVDWSDDPIGDLASIWELWKPQAAAYLQRALDPREAPSYGVPGDE